MTCPCCEIKDEEIRHLRRELGLRMADGEIGALMSRLGVSPTQARLLRVLYAAKGRTVGHGALIDELPMDGDQESLKSLVCRMRKVIGEKAIETAHGHGYALTAGGLSLVLGALQPVELQDARDV